MKSMLVNSGDTQHIERHITVVAGRRILYKKKVCSVLGSCLGVKYSSKSENKIICRHGCAVAPLSVLIQMKSIRKPVRGNIPAFRHTAFDIAVRVRADKSLKQICDKHIG